MGGRRENVYSQPGCSEDGEKGFFFLFFYCLLSFCWGMDSAGGYYIFNLKKKKYSRREIFFSLPCRVVLNYFSWPSQLTTELFLCTGSQRGDKKPGQRKRTSDALVRDEPRALWSGPQSCAGRGASSPWELGRDRHRQTQRKTERKETDSAHMRTCAWEESGINTPPARPTSPVNPYPSPSHLKASTK